MLGETKRLETLRGEQGELTAPQLETLAELAVEQESLVGELARLRAQLDQLAAFELVLTGIEREMTAAGSELRRGVTGPTAQTPPNVFCNDLRSSAVQMRRSSAAGGRA